MSVIVQGGTTPLHIGKRKRHIVYFKVEKLSIRIVFWDIVAKRGGWVLKKKYNV